jgi:predicted SnoaL-like aldol condensation-catalyzing enzyme
MNSIRRRMMVGGALISAWLARTSDAQGVSASAQANSCESEKTRLERNKQTVRAFYDLAFNQSKPAEAIERYAGATYIQHNPEVADGRQGFIDYFNAMAKRYGDKKRVEFIRWIAEGDLVTVHCRHTFREWHGETTWAGIDIFRLDTQGKIVEHWDVLQKVPSRMAHANGMF